MKLILTKLRKNISLVLTKYLKIQIKLFCYSYLIEISNLFRFQKKKYLRIIKVFLFVNNQN